MIRFEGTYMSPAILQQQMTDVFNNIAIRIVSLHYGLVVIFGQLTSIPIMVDQVDPRIVKVLVQIGYLLQFEA